ncbi:RecE family exodeoxyribonuclease [Serratia liquefaciens]|uniref:RecE family exodeoxyribonuclease n=1 Tax=Serratia liquefaciens TaxID=614 RepID=UPI0037F26FA0
MQNMYTYHLKAKLKSGKPSLFIWFEAKNDARAKRDLENHIEDAELDPADYFKPVRTNYPVVDDLPPEAEFYDKWCDRYALDENLSWQVIPGTAGKQMQAQEKPVSDELSVKTGANTDTQTAQLPANDGDFPSHSQEPRAYFAKMSADTRAVAVLLHNFNVIDTVLTKSQMKTVVNTALSGDVPYIANMLQALRVPAVSCMDPERFAAFVSGVARRYEESDPESTFNNIRKYVEQLLQPAPVADETVTKTVYKRGYTQTYDALDREIACALWVGDVNFENIAGEIDRWAQKKIKNDDEDFKRWSMALRSAPNILKYSRETIFGVIRNVPSSDTYHFPDTLRRWIERYLSEHGVYEFGSPPEAEQQIIANEAECTPEPKPEAPLTAQTEASIQGEKVEMGIVSAMGTVGPESERRAWIRNEVMEALSGKTRIMSQSDVAELMATVSDGSASLTCVARLVAIDIEPHDPLCQLSADDVHHITCDVLENWNNNWINEPDPRAAFINERVEFNLKESRLERERQNTTPIVDATGSGANQQESAEMARAAASNEDEKTEITQQHQSAELRSMGGGHFDVSTLFDASPLAGMQVDNGPAVTDEQHGEPPEQPCNDTSKDGEKVEVAPQQESRPAGAFMQAYFEPGRYADISNAAYHSANGISSTQVKDARISLMYYHGRHVIKTIGRERSDALTFGSLVHTLALEPENLERDFNVEPIIPDGAFTNTASMRAFIEAHNGTLPKMADIDTLRAVIDEHNAKLPTPYALGGNADEIGRIYALLPPEFQNIPDGQKFTATAMKACVKEYNSTLLEPLKTSGGRDALLEQLAIIDPEFAAREVAIPSPLPVSGTKEEMGARIKTILPTAIFADELIDAWKNSDDGRQLVTQQQMQHAKAIQRALFTHPSAGPLLQHEHRAVEASYFGFDEETGLEVRVRPDLEIDLNSVRVGVDLKSVSMGRVKQDSLRAKLHREIIDRDYHLSAAMYSEVAAFDQFFWIFVNKDEGYHWVAIVEASPDELELGRLEYKKALRDIKHAYDTDIWPAPITEEIVDDLNEYDQRRMEALRVA